MCSINITQEIIWNELWSHKLRVEYNDVSIIKDNLVMSEEKEMSESVGSHERITDKQDESKPTMRYHYQGTLPGR